VPGAEARTACRAATLPVVQSHVSTSSTLCAVRAEISKIWELKHNLGAEAQLGGWAVKSPPVEPTAPHTSSTVCAVPALCWRHHNVSALPAPQFVLVTQVLSLNSRPRQNANDSSSATKTHTCPATLLPGCQKLQRTPHTQTVKRVCLVASSPIAAHLFYIVCCAC
jgi:hypothetical protein